MTAMRMLEEMPQERKIPYAQCQKGSALVEFALILPLFLVLLFGMVFFLWPSTTKPSLPWPPGKVLGQEHGSLPTGPPMRSLPVPLQPH